MKNIAVFFLVLFFATETYAQLAILPPVVFIDSKSRSGITMLRNNSDEPKEIIIDFKFGYISFGENGSREIITDDKVAEKNHSLVPYIKVFPKKLLLPPKGQQTVRFIVKPMNNQPDGTYWTRLSVSSKDAKPQIEEVTGEQVKVDFELVSALSTIVLYLKGDITTGLKIKDIKSSVNKDNVVIDIDFDRSEGNTPFWGNIKFLIYDSAGNLVEDHSEPLSVYFDSKGRFLFNKSKFTKKGSYRAEIEINNDRKEIPTDIEIKFNTIERTFNFVIP